MSDYTVSYYGAVPALGRGSWIAVGLVGRISRAWDYSAAGTLVERF